MIVDNTDKHFKGQQRGESIVYYIRKHWISQLNIFVEGIAFVGVLAGFVFTAFALNEMAYIEAIMVAVIAVMTIWLHHIFTNFLNYFLNIIVVTNFRIIILDKSVYLRDNKDVVDLHEIQDIKKIQHGIIPNLLNYGKLVIVVPTMIAPMIIDPIGDPEKFFRKVNNAKRDYIYQRQQQRLEVLSGSKQPSYAISRTT